MESIDNYLAEIDALIDEARSMPLSPKKLIDTDELSRIIEDIRSNLPKEITAAKRIYTDKKGILDNAQREADGIIAAARKRADEMVTEHQITKEAKDAAQAIFQTAKKEADELVANAKAAAQNTIEKAEKYDKHVRDTALAFVDNALKASEKALTESNKEIASLRKSIEVNAHKRNAEVYDAID